MRDDPPASETGYMAYTTHFLIGLDLDATPIAGYIASEEDARRPFHGWLELSSAIEERRTARPGTAGLGRTAAPLPSPRASDSSRTLRGASHPRARRSGAFTGQTYRGVRHPGVAAWLTQCTQPRWMLLGAWTCAGWSAVAIVAVAATRHPWVLAWWGLGLLAILVLLTFIWTEQLSKVDPDDHDQLFPGGSPTPSQDAGLTSIDRHCVEQDLLACSTGRNAARCAPQPRNAFGVRPSRRRV
jgi:hypothetical protein